MTTAAGTPDRLPGGGRGDLDPALPVGLSRQTSIYRRAMEVCDQLADAALRGTDTTELAAVFAAVVEKRIVLLDGSFVVRAEVGGGPAATGFRWDRSDPSVDRLARALQGQRRPLRVPAVPGSLLERSCVITPVAVSGNVLGYLIVVDPPDAPEPDEVELLTLTYAATLFALTLANERTSSELGLRYQRAIVDALVSGHFLDAQDAAAKARSLGLPATGAFRVGVVRPGGGGAMPGLSPSARAEAVGDELSAQLAAAGVAAAITVRNGAVVIIVPETGDDLAAPPGGSRRVTAQPGTSRGTSRGTDRQPGRRAAAGPALAELLAELLDPSPVSARPTCGLSERLDSPEQAPRGLLQAEQAIDLGLRLGRAGQVISYEELGIYRLLLQIGDMRLLWRFADEVLGPLISYDAGHKLDLVDTLSVYLRHHGSLKQAARTLRLHANTVAYRAQRIQALTGLDLDDPEDRLVAHVAVKIIESQRAQAQERDE